MGEEFFKCRILVNVNFFLFIEYVKYVNLVLLLKGSFVLLVCVVGKICCILYCIFRELMLMIF